MKMRCQKEGCNKKLELSAVPCKCEKFFCSVHRGCYDHPCSFDYKNEHKMNLLKTMSTAVRGTKVEAI